MSKSFIIRFIRNFTLEPIEFWLKRELRQSGIEVDCQFGGFANAADEINSLSQVDAQKIADLVVLALGMEMTAKDFGHASWSAASACERHQMLVQAAVEKSILPLVINTVLPPLFSATGLSIISSIQSHSDRIDNLNKEIKNLAAQHPGKVVLIDWRDLARELGEEKTYDYRFWYSSASPFAAPFLMRYAAGLASVTRALTGKIRKCLILDCDNTLWGGIVGEDGRDGIQLSSDTVPGAYFQTFQRSILDLYERGIIIALCSKNNEADVFDILDNHADCIIHREHLAAWRINWNDKAKSIAEIATELNIGRDALIFIDDSPHECELVRSIFPEILVLQTPAQHEELVHFLHRQYLFDTLIVTEEDVHRTQSYQQNRAREALFSSVADLSDYKKKLGTHLTIRNACPADIARVTQLLQRTNQFNLTTRRHDQVEVKRMISDPDTLVIGAELEDRFGDLGLIGVAIVKRNGSDALIDTMLMSCRALGRDAELAFSGAIFNIIDQQWHSKQVLAEYIPSAKNGLVADFWKQVGLFAVDCKAKPDKAVLYGSPMELAKLACYNKFSYITIKDLTDGR
jgi:FkbH-like protein